MSRRNSSSESSHRPSPTSTPPPLPAQSPRRSFHAAHTLKECIEIVSIDVKEIENLIYALDSNIATICRCVRQQLPAFVPHTPANLPQIYRDLSLEEAQRANHAQRLKSKLRRLASSVDVPDAKCDLNPSGTIHPAYEGTAFERKALETELDSLVMKKAELEVDVDRLQAGLLYWGGVYEEQRSVREKRERLPADPRNEEKVSSGLRNQSLESEAGSSKETQSAPGALQRKSAIRRKQVAVRDMMERVRNRVRILGRAEKRDRPPSQRSSSEEVEAQVESLEIDGVATEKGKQREDSGVDLSGDIEHARRELDIGLEDHSQMQSPPEVVSQE